MSLDTYTNLKADIKTWLQNRTDVDSAIDTWIDLVEADANMELRTRWQETEATADATEYMALPADFLQMRDIQVMSTPRVQLTYVTSDAADTMYTSGQSGIPQFYTMQGNQIRLIPAPSSAFTIRMAYWEEVDGLSGTTQTNWLLRLFPQCYLAGVLAYARGWLLDEGRAEQWAALYTDTKAKIKRAGARSNIGGSLTIRAV